MPSKTTSTCTECGMVLNHEGEFHPYIFCVLKKAGRDPWADLVWLNAKLGIELPAQPPLVRDLPKSGDRV